MNIYNIHNFVLPKKRRPSYLYNVSMYFPNPKRVVDENNSSSFICAEVGSKLSMTPFKYCANVFLVLFIAFS